MIQIILGPMFAGKTSALMREYTNCPISKVIIDFNTGNETGHFISTIKNHDSNTLQCIKAKNLCDLFSYEINTTKHIFINEAQFFPDLLQFVKKYMDRYIYIYGLDGDFKRNPIGQILDVIPFCDSVIKLKAKCLCGADAIFTQRDSNEMVQYLPHAKYTPCCRACYLENK